MIHVCHNIQHTHIIIRTEWRTTGVLGKIVKHHLIQLLMLYPHRGKLKGFGMCK